MYSTFTFQLGRQTERWTMTTGTPTTTDENENGLPLFKDCIYISYDHIYVAENAKNYSLEFLKELHSDQNFEHRCKHS